MLEAAARNLGTDRDDGWLDRIRTDEVALYNWLLDLTLAQLPRVEALSLTLPYISGALDLGNLLEKPIDMSSVRRLHVTHMDQEDGMIDLGEIRALLATMPKLEALDVHLGGGATEGLPLCRTPFAQPHPDQSRRGEPGETRAILPQVGKFRV